MAFELAKKEKRNPTEAEAYKLLSRYKMPVPKYYVTSSKEGAIKIANEIGFPLVMKIISSDIVHKSDIGGVKINILNNKQVAKAYQGIIQQVGKNRPKAKRSGMLLYKQAPEGIEVVVGMIRDSQFGPTVMFGLGGIFVEILKDVSFRVCPVDRIDVDEMLREIKGIKLLQGYRGQSKRDINAIGDIILSVSELALDHPDIMEIDLNPIIVYERGAVVVDAKVFLNNDKKIDE